QRAFAGLLTELNRAYGQPARNDAEMLSQHALALQASARFLKRMGPEGDLAHFADQFAKLAQMFWDLNEGVRVPMLCPALAKRSDQTLVWLARARVVIAVQILRQCGYRKSIESAAKWVAQKYPGLKQLVTESGEHRGERLSKTITYWCNNFSEHKIRNKVAAGVYDKLKAWVSSCNSDQMESATKPSRKTPIQGDDYIRTAVEPLQEEIARDFGRMIA